MDLRYRIPTNSHDTRGVGLVEAIIVISVMSVAFAALLHASVVFVQGGLRASDTVQAVHLLEEGVEAVRFLRDDSFSTHITPLIGAGVRYLEPTATDWTVTTTNNPILSIYTRSITLTPVYRRNSDDDIVPSTSGDPKSVDPGTALLTVTVSWHGTSESVTTYITDLYDN